MISIIGISLVIYSIIGIFLLQKIRKETINSAKSIADSHVKSMSNYMTAELNSWLNQTIGMSYVFQSTMHLDNNEKINLYKNCLQKTLNTAPDLLSVWLSVQLFTLDENWDKDYGRIRFTYYNTPYGKGYQEDTLDTNGFNKEGEYYKLSISGKIDFSEPYFDAFGSSNHQFLMTSICVPMYNEQKKFFGLAGVDIDLEKLRKFSTNTEAFKESYFMIISNGGTVVIHPDSSGGIKIDEIIENNNVSFADSVQQGKAFSCVSKIKNKNYYVSFAHVS